jgi:hypothetical protein
MTIFNSSKLLKNLVLLVFLSTSNTVYAGWSWVWCTPGYKQEVSVPDNSSLFEPKINIKETTCIGFGKYTETMTLTPPPDSLPDYCETVDEQGNIQYSDAPECTSNNCGTIMLRYCARYAGPGSYGNTFSCGGDDEEEEADEEEEDNEEAEEVVDDPLDDANTFVDKDGDGLDDAVYCPDEKCPGCRCECTTRLCVFDDPGMPWDAGDTSEIKMPYHEMTKGEDIDFYNALSVNAYMSLYYNQNVTSTVGCVEIPLGPYPPPLCDPIQASKPVTKVFNICEYSTNYEISNTSTNDDTNSANYKQVSISSNPCEFSTGSGLPTDTGLYSTFERPIVRLYFDNPVPICDSGYVAPPEGTTKNDVCFWFDSNWSAEDIWQNQKNLLKVCPSGGPTTDCVNFPSGRHDGPIGSSDSFGQDYLYFRPYYSISGAQEVEPSSANPYAEYEDQGVTISLNGLYDSYYVDMRGNNDETVVDFMSYTRNFTSYFNLEGDDGMKICIDEIKDDGEQVPIDCDIDRPPMFTPTVEACLDDSDCYYNNGDTLEEEPRIKFHVGRTFTDIDGTTVKPKTGVIAMKIPNSDSSPPFAFCVQDDNNTSGGGNDDDTSPCTLYSAKIFDAYLTDDVNTKLEEEFDTDNSGPDTAGTTSLTDNYTGGIQYSDYVYCRGATKVCLAGYENSNKKVVAKLITNPETNIETVSNKLTDRVIPPYDPNVEQKLTDDQLFDPETDYWTSGSDTTSTYVAIGWRSDDGRGGYNYFEESTCTSGSTSCTPNVDTYPTDDITCMCTNSTSTEAYECPDNSLCQWAFEQEYTSSSGSVLGYKYTGSTGTQYYSSSDYGERKVNSMELGLCVEAAQEQCAEINETISSETADNNGYASWEATNAGDTSIGTCVGGTVRDEDTNGNALDPIRTCEYIDEFNADGTAKLEDNGCPKYSIAFGLVSNPCVTLPYPTWWPSQFLANNANTNNEVSLQGAIFNMFNVTYYYRDKFVPKSGYENYDAFGDILTNGSSDMVEDWYTTSTYDSCKDYRTNRNLTNTPRTKTDGDQEMLFLSQSNWRWLWDNNDLTWLLDDSTSSNGCWVYKLNSNVKATLDGISVGMKICKYNNKISFSLVETSDDLAEDCNNTAYIMQSNIIAYDQYLAQFIGATGRDGSFYPETEVSNQLNTGRDVYQHNINHGIVINKNGFPVNDYVSEITPTAPPFTYPTTPTTCRDTAEGLTAEFLFAGQYKYNGSDNYKKYTYNPDSIDSSCTGSGNHEYNQIQEPSKATYTCALDAYRENIDYSTSIDISHYLPIPDNINPSGYSNDSDMSGSTSYISKMYQYTCYSGQYKQGTWPQQTECRMEITLKNPVIGNSARNPHMFYWASPTSYRPCNQ